MSADIHKSSVNITSFFHSKLLPAVTLNKVDTTLKVAESILEGGLDVMEITFRTPVTAEAVSAVSREFPDMHIGAGTILSKDQLAAAKNAGAQFGLAPGLNEAIVSCAQSLNFPFIPGVLTPSEIETAMEYGCGLLKLFPVSNMGGADYIKRLEGPYFQAGLRLLPMGGINQNNLKPYLACRSVAAAGGSWMTPETLIEEEQFSQITQLVKGALKIISGANQQA